MRKKPKWRPRRSEGKKELELKRGRRAEGAPDGPQTKDNPADMRAGRPDGVASKGDSWARRNQRERGSSAARHSDWNIWDGAH